MALVREEGVGNVGQLPIGKYAKITYFKENTGVLQHTGFEF